MRLNKKNIALCSLGIIAILLVASLSLYVAFENFDSKFKADYYFNKAYDLDEKSPKGSLVALKYYQKAVNTYTAIGDKDGTIGAYIHLGLLHFKFGNVLQVERSVMKALEIGGNNIPRELQAKAYLLVAGTSAPEKAREYVDKALEIANQDDLKPQIAKAYYLLGKTYEYQANFEDAEKSYLKAVQLINDFPSTAYFIDIVSLYESLGELYVGDGEVSKAIKYYDEALAYSFKDDETITTAHYMKVLGDLYSDKNEINKACEFWRKSQDTYAYIGRGKSSAREVNIPDKCKIAG